MIRENDPESPGERGSPHPRAPQAGSGLSVPRPWRSVAAMTAASKARRKVRPGRQLETTGTSRGTSEGWTLSDWVFVVGGIAALVLLTFHVREYFFLTDDSFISFRYARNLLNGQGLVVTPISSGSCSWPEPGCSDSTWRPPRSSRASSRRPCYS
jgi:hypothetical protein